MCMRMKADVFTLSQLEQIHREIVSFKKILKPDIKELKNITKKFRQYCEMVIWGDKFNTDFVDYFCQVKSLQTMIQIFAAMKDQSILVAVIEGVSMLLINLSRQQSINYFLSNSSLMKFQMMKFSSLDTELAQYYINFLKSVSIRLNNMTVKLFYNQKYSNFPLIWQAIKFYNHPEALIRNTSKNIILSVAKLDDEKVQKYMRSFPFIVYYSHLAYFIFDTSYKIDKYLNQDKLQIAKLNQYYDQLYDTMIYFEDLLAVMKDNQKDNIINAYMQGVIVFMKSLFSPKMSMFFFSLLIRQGGCSELVNMTIMMLMGRYTKKDFMIKLKQIQSIHRLKSHNKKWSFHGFWDDFVPQLAQYSRNNFNTLQIQPQLGTSQSVNLLAQTFHFKSPPLTPQSTTSIVDFNNKMQQVFSKDLFESQMISQYSTKDTHRDLYSSQTTRTPFESQLYKLQRIHSVQIDPNSLSSPSLSILQTFKLFQSDLKQSFLDLDEMQQNPTKLTIIEYIKSEDQHLIILVVDLLKNILKNKVVSKEVLNFAGLDLEKVIDFYNLQTVGKIMNYCLDIFRVEKLVFDIKTYKKILDLIEYLCQKQHIKSIHKQSLEELLKQYLKNIITFFSSSISASDKMVSYQLSQKQKNKSITGLGFLQLISQSTKICSQDKQIIVCILLMNLRDKLFHKPLKAKKIISNKSQYPLGNKVQITAKMTPFQLMDNSQKTKKCYSIFQNFNLILIQKSTSKVFFNIEINKLQCIQDTAIPKRNTLRVKQNEQRCSTFKLIYQNQKSALKEYEQFKSVKNQKAQTRLNQIINQFIQYQTSMENIEV